jgi:hypothetical protein
MADIKEALRRLLKELDAEEKDELLQSLQGKKLTAQELLEAIKELPPEARKEVREVFYGIQEEIDEEQTDEEKTKTTKTKATDENDDKNEEDETTKSKRKTRPGRKSGRAYGWWIDEDGKVIPLDIARIYSGEDEPDEVELLPEDKEEDEEDEQETA